MHISRFLFSLMATTLVVAAHAGTANGSPNSQPKGLVAKQTATGSAVARTQSTTQQRSAPGARASLLGGGAQPSQKVTEIIRERESSGPGWIGTAFLVSLLSRHDLSSSDKSWIEGRIADARKDGDPDESEPGLVPAVAQDVVFRFVGLDRPLHLDTPAAFTISAKDQSGKLPSLVCEVPVGARMSQSPGRAEVRWTPQANGVYILTCSAAGHRVRRLVRVDSVGAS